MCMLTLSLDHSICHQYFEDTLKKMFSEWSDVPSVFQICWDAVQFLSNDIIMNNEMVDAEEVKLPACTVFDKDIFMCAGMGRYYLVLRTCS